MTQNHPPSARSGAVLLLNRILGHNAFLSDARLTEPFTLIVPADRARAQRLAAGVLRSLPLCDALLKPKLKRPPPLPVMNILRLGVYELAQGAADHGVVNALVGQAGQNAKSRPFR